MLNVICEMLYLLHGNDFKFTGIDLFSHEVVSKDEYIPQTKFSNWRRFFIK